MSFRFRRSGVLVEQPAHRNHNNATSQVLADSVTDDGTHRAVLG